VAEWWVQETNFFFLKLFKTGKVSQIPLIRFTAASEKLLSRAHFDTA
jgi:EamA domain-containing membrane protein RarD